MNQIERDEDKKSERVAKGLTKALAVVGLIGLLAAAAWLSVQAFRIIPGTISRMMSGEGAAVTLSSLFSRGSDKELSITLGKTVVNAGEPLTITLNQPSGKDSTRYSFSFDCKEQATFTLQTLQGKGGVVGDTATTTCNSPLSFTVATDTLTITPVTKKDVHYLDVYMTVSALDANNEPSTSISNTALFTVVNDNTATSTNIKNEKSTKTATTSAKTSASTVHTQPVKTQPAYTPTLVKQTGTGPADLTVRITATGVSLGNKNEFLPTAEIPTTSRGAVKFVVENKGGVAAGPWGFTATLPIQGANAYVYTSPLQKSLNAGDKVEFVLGFDQVLEEKTGIIKISLIPGDKADNTTNNTAQTSVTIKNK